LSKNNRLFTITPPKVLVKVMATISKEQAKGHHFCF